MQFSIFNLSLLVCIFATGLASRAPHRPHVIAHQLSNFRDDVFNTSEVFSDTQAESSSRHTHTHQATIEARQTAPIPVYVFDSCLLIATDVKIESFIIW